MIRVVLYEQKEMAMNLARKTQIKIQYKTQGKNKA